LDRVRLIELIEGQTARLSLERRDLWEELKFIREFIPDPADECRMARESDVMERIFELPIPQQFLVSRPAELVAALRRSEEVERRGESGREHRVRGVINAAMLKDREEGQTVDPNMTVEQALARLKD
jgi:hypothetical protein